MVAPRTFGLNAGGVIGEQMLFQADFSSFTDRNSSYELSECSDELRAHIEESRYTEYNTNEFQSVVYNMVVSVGVQYVFGKSVIVPLAALFNERER